jgi:hypothetical protein
MVAAPLRNSMLYPHPACRIKSANDEWIKDMAHEKRWIGTPRTKGPAAVDAVEKRAIIAACEAFIRDLLKPRFLPEIRPTEWNHVVDIGTLGPESDIASCSATGLDGSTIAARSSTRRSTVSTAWDQTGLISTGCGTRANGGGSMPV